MKFFAAATATATAIAAALLMNMGHASALKAGVYDQVYSNAYVQSTTEMDWKCIQVYVYVNTTRDDSTTAVFVHKTAHLHGGPQIVTTPVIETKVANNSMTITSKATKVTKAYDIHDYSNDTMVITGRDDPALYVWTRQGSREDPVDIPRLLVYVQDLGFHVKDPIYSKIVSTYDKETCKA